jgi:flagellar biosynthesis protein FlhB
MADETDFQQKTEPPSPRRRERAYEEGQFPHSSELNTGVILFVGVGGMLLLAQVLGGGLLGLTRRDLALLPAADLTPGDVQQMFIDKFGQGLSIAGMLIGVLFVATLAVCVAQVGFNLNFDRLAMKWENIFPFQLSRLLGWDKVMRGLFLLCKIAAIGVVAAWIVRQRGEEITGLSDVGLAGAMAGAWNLTMRIALGLAATLLVIGVADYAYQRYRFESSLYMTKQEVKEEMKRDEGNPQTKARIRKLQRENAQRKMFHKVPEATVIVTNPTHFAVALQYEAGMSAPKVVAKGADHVAKRIIAIARKHAIPVVERKSLAQVLFKTVKVDQAIPIGLYVVIAELMAYVYRLKGGDPANHKTQ